MTLDEFFHGQPVSRQLFDILWEEMNGIDVTELRISKSQIAFYRHKAFAWVWIPGRYVFGRTAPLVLTFSFPVRDPSPRWKEIVEPSPGHFTHHLELYLPQDIDAQVCTWLKQAWMTA